MMSVSQVFPVLLKLTEKSNQRALVQHIMAWGLPAIVFGGLIYPRLGILAGALNVCRIKSRQSGIGFCDALPCHNHGGRVSWHSL
jgi:hypothetical protein